MPDELSLAVVGGRFDNPRRKGKPTGNRQTEILMSEPSEAVIPVPKSSDSSGVSNASKW